jgi:hypothetical protein
MHGIWSVFDVLFGFMFIFFFFGGTHSSENTFKPEKRGGGQGTCPFPFLSFSFKSDL